MAYLSIGSMRQIQTSDAILDRIADLLEHPPAGGGFWLAGQREVERNGETQHPDPANGHQRLWVPVTEPVLLVYDRPLHPSPDWIDDDPTIVLI